MVTWIHLLGEQFGWWGLALVLTGMWGWWQSTGGAQSQARRPLAVAFLAWSLLTGLYAFFYATTDSYIYLVPILLPLALAWGTGAGYLLRLAERKGPTWRRAALVIILLLPLGSLAKHWHAADLSDSGMGEISMQRALDAVVPDSLVVVKSDWQTFVLWYLLYAEGQRPDVAVVSGPLLAYPWYRDQVRRLYPELAVPEPVGEAVIADELVRELIAGNLDQRTVYATDPPVEWRAWFWFLSVEAVPQNACGGLRPRTRE